jgi:hypothetical protein
MAHVNADHPRTVWTPANKRIIIAAVEREPWRSSCNIAWQLDYPNCGPSKYFITMKYIHTTTRGAQVSRWLSSTHTILKWLQHKLQMSSFYATFCGHMKHVLHVRVCQMYTTVTSGQGIILMLLANVGIKSASASASRLVSSGTLSWTPICLQANCSKISWFSWNFYWDCLKMCLSGSGWTWHIQGGLDMEGWLLGLLGCWLLTMMDFFLRGHVKKRIYAVPPGIIKDLVTRLQAAVTSQCQHVKACSRECCAVHCRLPWNGWRLLQTPTVNYEVPMVGYFDGLHHLMMICILKTKQDIGHKLYNISNLFSNKDSHYGQPVYEFHFTLCIYKHVVYNKYLCLQEPM